MLKLIRKLRLLKRFYRTEKSFLNQTKNPASIEAGFLFAE
jgi:hypothetical protein